MEERKNKIIAIIIAAVVIILILIVPWTGRRSLLDVIIYNLDYLIGDIKNWFSKVFW